MRQSFTIALLLIFSYSHSQITGCTDPLAKNYNPKATVNNGSCKYAQSTVSPQESVDLPVQVKETSGLVKHGSYLYTHNDNTDVNLYALDTLTGVVAQTLPVAGADNEDWEDIAQDEDYFYIGNFGNNVNGNRTNLSIIRVAKQPLLSGNAATDNINFSFEGQLDFSPQGANATNFDCEALIVGKDSIYLFTKQWVNRQTSLFVLPKNPGTYVARYKGSYDVDGLITGATWIEDKRLVVLCGYSSILQPFFYLLYDFKNNDFFSGNKRKIIMSALFNQTEGIATTNGKNYFVTNEQFEQPPFVNVVQKLHRYDLSPYLDNYIENFALTTTQHGIRNLVRVYPNPTRDIVYVDVDPSISQLNYTLIDMSGQEVLNGIFNRARNKVNISNLQSGVYTIKLSQYPHYAYKLVKK